MRQRLLSVLAILTLLALTTTVTPAAAQRTSGAVGLGGQIGEPTGVTLKVYNANSPSYDFLAAWDLDDFFFLNAHALFEDNLDADGIDPELEWYIGPGGFIGVSDTPGDDEALIGASGTIGLTMIFNNRVELYGQITPRITLIPETDGEFGGGIGLRYYF